MNKDRVKGKIKDVAGRVERQAGEWTGDPEKQAHGAAKQVEGKVQNAWGKAKDAADEAATRAKTRKEIESDEPIEKEEAETEIDLTSRKKAS
jgi:uncharacterized protein YjbJ (UPF0337 family)